MKPIGKALTVLFLTVALGTLARGQITYYSQGSVAPDVTTNWNTNPVGGGASPADFITGDIFVIQNTHNMTTGGTWTVSGTAAEIQIASGGALTIANAVTTQRLTILSGGTATVNTAVTLTVNNGNAGGDDLQVSGILTLTGTLTYGASATGAVLNGGKYQHNKNGGVIPTFTWNTGSTCEVTGAVGSAPTGLNQSFYNFTWNCASQSSGLGLAGLLTTINGDFTVLATSTFDVRLTSSTNYVLNVGGNLVVSGGALNGASSNPTSAVINVAGNVNISGGTFWQQNGGGSTVMTVKVTGDVNVTSGTYNMSNNGVTQDSLFITGNLNISGGTFNPSSVGTTTSNTTIKIGGNFSLSGTGAFTPGNTGSYTMTVGGGFSISAGTYTYSVGTSSSKTYTLNVGGNFSMTGGSLVYNNTSGTTNGILNFVGGSASVTYAQSAGTITPNATASGVNWVIANGKTVTFNDAFTLPSTTTARTFTVQSGGQLVVGAAMTNNGTIVDAGTITNNSTILINGTFQLNEGGIVASTALTYGASGTLSYNGTSAQAMTNAEFPASNGPFNLTINNASGVVLNAPRTINGTLTLTSGILSGCTGYLTLGSGATISRSGGLLDAAPLLFTGGTNLIYTTSAGVITTGFEKPAAANNLTINNALGVTLGAPLVTVSGTVTLTSGLLSGCTTVLALGSGATISRSGGSLDAAPTFGATTNVIYTAPAPPALITTGFELPAAVNNLTINNSSGVTLSAITAVGGILTMTSGNINLNSFAMSLGSSTSSTGTLTYTSGFLTGSGSFTRWFNSSTISGVAGQFPMGVGSNDRSVYLGRSVGSSGGTVTVQYADASGSTQPFGAGISETPGTIINRSNANWAIGIANGFMASSGATLGIVGGGMPGVTDLSNLTISAVAGAAAGTYAAATGSLALPQVNRSMAGEADLVGTFYIASTSTSPLPVEMSTFVAKANRLRAELHWSTATEVNNYGFEIERKAATQSWMKVGFVEGAGMSNTLHKYSYTDNVGQAGLYEYRIKQVDKGGSYKYSSVMQVEVGMAPKVLSLGENYPNPFNPSTSIEFSVPTDGKASLKVYNMLGQEVANLFDGTAVAGNFLKVKFDASKLSSGVYFSRLEVGGKALVKRMMLLK